jgi:hypothetical protein
MQQVYHPVQITNSPMSNLDLTGARFRQLDQQVTKHKSPGKREMNSLIGRVCSPLPALKQIQKQRSSLSAALERIFWVCLRNLGQEIQGKYPNQVMSYRYPPHREQVADLYPRVPQDALFAVKAAVTSNSSILSEQNDRPQGTYPNRGLTTH